MRAVDRQRLSQLLATERERFRRERPRSANLHEHGQVHLLAGVPMTWMAKAAGGFPVALATARGARVTDVDGHQYVDLSLGDTAAMAGHSPEPLVRALRRRVEDLGGLAAMMPTEDAAAVAAELTRRFGVTAWSFALTATDANRWVLRLARHVTRRPKVLVHSWCYHGTVD
ncbi:MAG: aminotransferase class III-fold pyridoxal phosphate-dependent enzyme, partial [Actinomycetes bacterium]